MHYSGILVRAMSQRLDQCAAQVSACDGVEVFLRHDAASCLVAVIESETLQGQEDRLRAVQDLSAVASASLVYHRADDGEDPAQEEVLP